MKAQMFEINPHPAIPPSDLLKQWEDLWFDELEHADVLLIRAFQAGADQQLAEDAKWLDCNALNEPHLRITPVGESLKEAMRPQQLSLKEQSIALINRIQGNKEMWDISELNIIRKALEQLNG